MKKKNYPAMTIFIFCPGTIFPSVHVVPLLDLINGYSIGLCDAPERIAFLHGIIFQFCIGRSGECLP